MLILRLRSRVRDSRRWVGGLGKAGDDVAAMPRPTVGAEGRCSTWGSGPAELDGSGGGVVSDIVGCPPPSAARKAFVGREAKLGLDHPLTLISANHLVHHPSRFSHAPSRTPFSHIVERFDSRCSCQVSGSHLYVSWTYSDRNFDAFDAGLFMAFSDDLAVCLSTSASAAFIS